MTGPIPTSYDHVVQRNQAELQILIERGVLKPFFLYHLLVYTCLPLSALLVSRKRGSKYVRLIIFTTIVGTAVDTIRYRRSLVGANGYMVGLIMMWWIVWSATLLVFNDAEEDFKRIERGTVSAAYVGNESGRPEDSEDDSHRLPKGNGIRENPRASRYSAALRSRRSMCSPSDQPSQQAETLKWQAYPRPFLHRLNWSLGLLFNMRGPEWNWRISSLGPLPPAVHAQLNPHSDLRHGPKDPVYPSPKTRLTAAFVTFIKSYLCLDIAKCLMMRDPYFWGAVSSPPPPPFPFNSLTGVPILVRLYRLHLTAFGLISALTFICTLNPIVFLGLSLAFPNASRSLTSVPLDAPWLYRGAFGPFIVPVLDHGLAGCWGQWWHQLFRFGFTSPARWLLSHLPAKLASNPQFRQLVMAVFAFAISGALHACGSYTQFAETNPLSGTFLYFVFQAVGITVQNIFSSIVWPKMIYRRELPRWSRRAANFTFAYIWLMGSGSFIADDFARGGVWLTEPIPVSLFRVMGLSVTGDWERWWCWRGPWFRYWSDGSWWQSGVQVL